MSPSMKTDGFKPLGETLSGERAQLLQAFHKQGLPGPRSENWKYTRLKELAEREWRAAGKAGIDGATELLAQAEELAGKDLPCLVLLNGRFQPELSRLGTLPAGCEAGALEPADETALLAAAIQRGGERHPLDTLNAAAFQGGAVIRVQPGAQAALHLVHLLSESGEDATCLQSRVRVEVGEGAKLELRESFLADAPSAEILAGQVAEIRLARDSRCEHIRLQRAGSVEWLYTLQHIDQLSGSRYDGLTLGLDGQLVRNESSACLRESGAHCDFSSLGLLDDVRHMDSHTWMDHAVPSCTSGQNFRSVLADRSRSVYSGHILVRQDAQLTDAVQDSKALLLSAEARANARPQLEIYADDVKCTHGSTVGSLEEEQLFYLRSRGIDSVRARQLLVRAFCAEVLESLSDSSFRERLETLVGERMENIHG